MTGRSHRFVFTPLLAVTLAVLVLGGATLGWATNREAEPFGQRFGPVEPSTSTDGRRDRAAGDDRAGADDPDHSSGTSTSAAGAGLPGSGLPGSGLPGSGLPGSGDVGPGLPGSGSAGAGLPGSGTASTGSGPAAPASTGSTAGAPIGPFDGGPVGGPAVGGTAVGGTAAGGAGTPAGGSTANRDRGTPVAAPTGAGRCRTGADLVPTCGVLFGVAAGVSSGRSGTRALHDFEEKAGRHQDIHRAYHRGTGTLFPTAEEIAISREPGRRRILFLSWKPTGTSWAKIAKGDRRTDEFLDRLAGHLRSDYREDFFFTVHHSAEDEVRAARGSGYTAGDYAAMYRHVVRRLRARGVDNLVTVLVHAADPAPADRAAVDRMYPGDDVVDWIGLDTEAPGRARTGGRDLAGLLGGRAAGYTWASTRHPGKPLMISEWSLWSSPRDPGRRAAAYRELGRQIGRFPRIRAMVYVDTPQRRDGLESRVDATPTVLRAYRRLGALPTFQVDLKRG